MAEAGAIFTVVKYGLDAYEYFQACNDKKCFMKVKVESGNKLIFSAYDHRSILVKMTSRKPWEINYDTTKLGYEWNRKGLKEKVYKEITVVCQNNEEFRRLLDKYFGNERIKQSDLIGYLKVITRHGFVNLKLVEKTIPLHKYWDTGRFSGDHYWDEYTAIYELDAR